MLVLQASARAAHGVGHGLDGLLLADEALAEALLHVQEFLALALRQTRCGDARPGRDDLGDVALRHLFLQQAVTAALQLGERRARLFRGRFGRGDFAVEDFRGAPEVALALGLLGFRAQGVDLFLGVAGLGDDFLLALPLGDHGLDLLLGVGKVAGDLLQSLARVFVLLLGEGLALHLQLHGRAVELVDFTGHGVQLDLQAGSGLVNEVDGLVGQESVRDVAVAQGGGGHEGAVGDVHAVVHLVAFLEASQNGDGVFDARLGDVDGLEAALQSRVFLDVLAVLIERGRADGAQLAARQRGLEEVCGVHRAVTARTGAHQGVELVDEEDDFAVARRDFLDEGFESLLELAAVFRAGEHRADVQRDEALAFHALGHVAVDDASREAFGDGRLAHARLTDEHGVVFRAAREDLQHAANLRVTADDGVNLALTRAGGEVRAVFLQRLVFLLRVLIGDALVAADLLERLHVLGLGEAGGLERARQFGVLAHHAQHEVLDAQVVVLHLAAHFFSRVEVAVELLAQAGALRDAAALAGLLLQQALHLSRQALRVNAGLVQHRGEHAALLLDESQHQLRRVDLSPPGRLRAALCGLQGFHKFCGEVIIHLGVLDRVGVKNVQKIMRSCKLS